MSARFGTRRGAWLRGLLARRGAIVTNLEASARRDLALICRVRGQVPLLMQDAAALTILAAARAVRHLGADYAEAGVFRGGSARLIAEAKGDVPLHLFDVFETLQGREPPGDAAATAVRDHFGPTHGRQAEVAALLAGVPGVAFHPGVFPASATGLEELRFAFVHLDLDLPAATAAALDFFHPRLLPGGVLVGDDHQDPGVRDTFATWFAGRPDTRIVHPWGQIVVVKAS